MLQQNDIITITSGDNNRIVLKTVDVNNEPIDLENYIIFFTVKDNNGNVIINKSTVAGDILKDNPTTTGLAFVIINQYDTFNLAGSFKYDVEYRKSIDIYDESNQLIGHKVAIATKKNSAINIKEDLSNG